MEESHGDVKNAQFIEDVHGCRSRGRLFKKLTLELKLNTVIGLHQMNHEWKTVRSTGKNIHRGRCPGINRRQATGMLML